MEKKKFFINKAILIVLCVLCGLMTIMEWYLVIADGWHVLNIIKGLVYLAVVYYAVFAYKRPHGNELKYIILFTSFFILVQSLLEVMHSHSDIAKVLEYFIYGLTFAVVILMSYVAGRLDRIKQNKIIFLVVLTMCAAVIVLTFLRSNTIKLIDLPTDYGQIVAAVTETPKPRFNFMRLFKKISYFDMFMQYLALMVAYLCRYQLHKEAGMKDK